MSKILNLTNRLLNDIKAAMNENHYEMDWYLDLQEEKTTFLGNPDITGMYEEHEKLKQQIEEDEEGRFVPIPGTPSREGWKQMEHFILSLDDQDENTQDLLLNTIQGKGAFGRFQDAVYRIGLQDRWYEFKNREDRKAVLDWLQSRDLISGEQMERGMQLYEEQLQKRNRRNLEIINMTKGRYVTCRSTAGHEDKLTAGKKYEILEEQEQQPNIKVNDDRGKICWLPKSHFELIELNN